MLLWVCYLVCIFPWQCDMHKLSVGRILLWYGFIMKQELFLLASLVRCFHLGVQSTAALWFCDSLTRQMLDIGYNAFLSLSFVFSLTHLDTYLPYRKGCFIHYFEFVCLYVLFCLMCCGFCKKLLDAKKGNDICAALRHWLGDLYQTLFVDCTS